TRQRLQLPVLLVVRTLRGNPVPLPFDAYKVALRHVEKVMHADGGHVPNGDDRKDEEAENQCPLKTHGTASLGPDARYTSTARSSTAFNNAYKATTNRASATKGPLSMVTTSNTGIRLRT